MFSDQNSTYECHYIGFDIIKLRFNNWKLVWIKHPKLSLILGFPPEFRVTVYVRKWSGNFFHFHYGKGSGKPEFRNDFFFVKRKFPERCSGITDRYGIPENFRFPFILELSRNSSLRNKFPDHSISKMEIFSGKMETLEITQKYWEIPQKYLSGEKRKPLKNFRKRLKIKRKPLRNCVLRDFHFSCRNCRKA